jgi:GDPmannose 4,6-dehydratase
MKTALITGITGQDGSYLAELLLKKGYRVHGIIRRASSFNTQRIDHLYKGHDADEGVVLHYGDLLDATSLLNVLLRVLPDEIYNLAAQSHVATSFKQPVYTCEVIATGTLKLLEAVRHYQLASGKEARIYQASSSEMFGNQPAPQDESTPFKPVSPYAAAKVQAHHLATMYREAYGMFVCCGILFNHESPRRGETFVTRKITRALTRCKLDLQETLSLGNLGAMRDWGYAPEYVEGMWRMMQQPVAASYVLATGVSYMVEAFVDYALKKLDLNWACVVATDRLRRPIEVDCLRGNPSKAFSVLGWKPQTSMYQLCDIMLEADMKLAEQELCLKKNGLDNPSG